VGLRLPPLALAIALATTLALGGGTACSRHAGDEPHASNTLETRSSDAPATTSATTTATPSDPPEHSAKPMDDSTFFSVPLNDYGRSACSPTFDDRSQVGLRIAAPSTIDLATHEVFPLCGTLRLQARFIAGLGHDPIEVLTVVVVNKSENLSLSFNLRPDKEPIESPELSEQPGSSESPDLSDFDESDIRENYLNVDLHDFSPELEALGVGEYTVYVTLTDLQSNTVEIEVVDSREAKP